MPEAGWKRWAYFGVPMLFCLAVHLTALKTWFWGDDFAWLGLPLEVREFKNWDEVLFGPRAQGTVRVLSERLYFLVFGGLFGINAIPFRIWAFLTQFANLALLSVIALRLTGSRLAGFAAPILWSSCAGLAVAMEWSSSYNELLCAFFYLASFLLFHKYVETGDRRFWIGQWVLFLVGFGALELMAMYPAVVFVFAVLFARRLIRRTLWLFLPSAAFTFWHFGFVPATKDPAYQMYWDEGIVGNFVRYFAFAAGAWRPEVIDWRPVWLTAAVAGLVALGALAMVRRGRLAIWCLAWFVLVLLPVLPLTQHFTEYYLTVPAIGLAILGAWAVASHPRAAGAVALASMVLSIADLQLTENFFYQRARRMKRVVTSLQAQSASYRGKKVLLSGVDDALFWSGFFDNPFRLIGIPFVYLTPGSEKQIAPHPEWGGIGQFTLSLETAMPWIKQNQAVVFGVGPDGETTDVTKNYAVVAASAYLAEHRDTVDVGNPLYFTRVGEGWYPAENGFRWMAKKATVQLGGPLAAGKTLQLSGYCPASVVSAGPLELMVSADGRKLGALTLRDANKKFSSAFALPDEFVGKYLITVTVEVNRTTQVSTDTRPLGLIFGSFRIQ